MMNKEILIRISIADNKIASAVKYSGFEEDKPIEKILITMAALDNLKAQQQSKIEQQVAN